MRFLRPKVPNLSQKDSSLSPDFGVTGRGDFDRGEAIGKEESSAADAGDSLDDDGLSIRSDVNGY
jgi:hypothetical protein